MLGNPILWCFAAVLAGVALCENLPVAPTACGGVLIGLLALLFVCLRRRRGVAIVSLLIFAVLGAWSGSRNEADVSVRALCKDSSQLWLARIDDAVERVLRPGHGGDLELRRRTVVDLVAERCGAEWQPREGRVRLLLRDGETVARGDLIQLRLELQPPRIRRNPHEPDPALIARRHALAGRAWVRSGYAHRERGEGLLAFVDRRRDRVGEHLEALLSSDDRAAVAKALALGDRGSVSSHLRDCWADAGMAHLLAISGLHVGIVAGAIFALLSALVARLPGAAERYSVRRVAALGAIPAILLFCLWTGGSPSAARATVMASAVLLGIALSRPNASINALGAAGVLLVLVDPSSLHDSGFLLSFTAVAALIVLPPVARRGGRLWRVVRASVAVSVATTVATAPLCAHFFGRVSLAAPFSNLLAVPFSTLVATPLALLFAVLEPLKGPLPHAVVHVLELCIVALDGLAARVARVPFAAVDVPVLRSHELVLYGAAILSALLAWRAPARLWPRITALAASAAFALSLGLRLGPMRGDGALTVLQPYVGQGDGLLLRLPRGGTVLVDAGGSLGSHGPDPGQTVIAPLLRRQGVRRIDLAVISHAHPDHVGGMEHISTRFPIDELWWSGMGAEAPAQHAVIAAVLAAGGKVRVAGDLPKVTTIEGVRFEVLHPRPGATGLSAPPYFPEMHMNDNSVVLRVSFGERSMLLTGDIERDAEALLATRLAVADVLKAPHHGSRTSSTAALLHAVRPGLVTISCGEANRFGVPHDEVLRRYASLGARVLRTDRDGLLELRTDGSTWQARTMRGDSFVFAE